MAGNPGLRRKDMNSVSARTAIKISYCHPLSVSRVSTNGKVIKVDPLGAQFILTRKIQSNIHWMSEHVTQIGS